VSSPTPVTPPTSAAAVADWLSKNLEDTASTEQLAPTVAAVNRFVRRLHDPGPDGWAEDHALGATMLAARLWRRRKSPEGVMSQFTAEGGAVYVQRHDPDVAMLLQLGPYAPPVVG
jgi:hypothetical protein